MQLSLTTSATSAARHSRMCPTMGAEVLPLAVRQLMAALPGAYVVTSGTEARAAIRSLGLTTKAETYAGACGFLARHSGHPVARWHADDAVTLYRVDGGRAFYRQAEAVAAVIAECHMRPGQFGHVVAPRFA